MAIWIVCLIYWAGISLGRIEDGFSLYRCSRGVCKVVLAVKEALEVPVLLGILAITVVFMVRVFRRKRVSLLEVLVALGTWGFFVYNLSFIRS